MNEQSCEKVSTFHVKDDVIEQKHYEIDFVIIY